MENLHYFWAPHNAPTGAALVGVDQRIYVFLTPISGSNTLTERAVVMYSGSHETRMNTCPCSDLPMMRGATEQDIEIICPQYRSAIISHLHRQLPMPLSDTLAFDYWDRSYALNLLAAALKLLFTGKCHLRVRMTRPEDLAFLHGARLGKKSYNDIEMRRGGSGAPA